MLKVTKYLLLIGFHWPFGFAVTAPLELTEPLLSRFAMEENPTQNQIKGTFLQVAQLQAQFDENFALQMVNSASYQSSKEKAIAPFIPVFSPSTELSVGLEKPFMFGGNANVGAFALQQSTTSGSIDNATRTGLRVGFSFDLWKNFAGSLDRAKADSFQFKKERAELDSQINQRVFELNIRKIYWSLIASEESIKVSRALYEASLKQMKESERRLRQSVADKGEVARYRAQVAARKSDLTRFEYLRGTLIESLQRQLPQLVGKTITLAPLSIEDKVAEVLACTVQIQANAEVPWENTKYDEVVQLLRKEHEKEQLVARRHSSVDLKLDSQLQYSGVDQGYGDSFDDLTGEGKFGYAVGLTLKIPLDGKKSKSRELQQERNRRLHLAQREKLMLEVKARHMQIGKLINYLYESLQNLQGKTKNLEISVKETERKYRQARVSVTDVINDQDALQASLLSEIETKLSVIHILLDYFQIFTETPCTINQLGEKV